ncbi:MAG: DNA polymerase III subunit alpha [Cyanobacteria bacterium J06555_3]
MSFVGLHIHSDYSLLDGASQIPQLIDRCLELDMPAIALTDHGVMYGAIELIKVCRKKGIKPIIGNEMYVINGDIEVNITEKKRRHRKYHQVVLAKNTQGYKNLVKLTTISHLKGYQGSGIFARPCINKELLEKYHEGLIITSACLGGEVPQAILKGDLAHAEKVAKWYQDLFGEDYYLEIQDHGSPEDRIVNVAIVNIARKLGIKLVATNDSHFISCYDVEAHDALLCILTQKRITDEKRLRYSGTEYLKSADEMRLLFRDHLEDEVIEEAIATTVEVADKIEPYNILGEPRIPDYPVPAGHTADSYLEEVTRQGLLERLKCRNHSEVPAEYMQRIEVELQVMQEKGFSTYFLVVWDYIKYARDNDIPVGPGRGSAAGSLVAYCLKITNIDPIHHGLLFERFLNPERKSMPDVDTDFCPDRRADMIEYVTEKYGEANVAQIITFNRMTSKAVLKDVGRVLGVDFGDQNRIAKMIPVARGKPAKLKVMISDDTPEPAFKHAYENEVIPVYNDNKEEVGSVAIRNWVDMAIRIEGTNKTFGVHAAGVVISSQPLDEIVPLQRNNDGSVITQYYMEDVEAMGLLKMDFLGLKNLTTIQRAANLVQKTKGVTLDLDQIPLDEKKALEIIAKGKQKKLPADIQETHKLFRAGNLEGIFQLESDGMKQITRDLKPSGIEDLSSISALYRPGPLDAGLIPIFIDRKHGREKVSYVHPILEPILKETYGVIVYQEQIMKIAQELAGYSLGEADLLRRCLSGSTTVVDTETGQLVTLKEIASNPQDWLNKQVFSLNQTSQKIEPQSIEAIYPNGIKDVWEITTRTNRRVKATKDHLFYTLLGWQKLEEFAVGNRIGLAKNLPINHQSDVSEAQIKLVAYLIGDGHLSTKSSSNSYFCNSDSRLIADFNQCCYELFGSFAPIDHQTHPGRKTVSYVRIGFLTKFNQWVDRNVKRARSRDKKIPQWVFSLGRKQLQLFLGTLWSTDGSFDNKTGHTAYNSTSKILVEQIQHLLLRVGIVALFNVKRITYNSQPHISYRAQVTGREEVTNFCELIAPYLSKAKYQQAKTCYQVVEHKLKSNSKHTIPQDVIHLIRDEKYSSGMTWKEIDLAVGLAPGTMSSGLNFKQPSRSLARHRVQNFATAFNSQRLDSIANSEVFWDEIVSIEHIGKEEVFDLTIPHNHNFIANDFVVHNCMGKKKLAEMEKHREKFIDGSARNGVAQDLANDLFDQMVLFAEYCLSYDTEVLTVEYGSLPIGKIVEKQIKCNVYSVDRNGFVYTQPIAQWHDRGTQEVFEYTLDNGATIKATKDHKFMTCDQQMLPIDEIFAKGLDLWELKTSQLKVVA